MSFARQFDEASDSRFDDSQSSIHHPLVYLFIGDQCREALEEVHRINLKKWNNSRGVVYLHLCTTEAAVSMDNVYQFRLDPPPGGWSKTALRRELADQLYNDGAALIELNRRLRQIGNHIAEFGRLYASLQQLNIAVVTRADDPFTAVLPEATLLMKQVLAESFRQVQADLYVLLAERLEEYSACLGVSFLKELDGCQSRHYSYHGMLRVTADDIRLPVQHENAPLFDLVYLLSDKNEQGLFLPDSLHANCQAICQLCLLKNRRPVPAEGHEQGEKWHNAFYNNQDYRRHISSSAGGEAVYSTAGCSFVERPNAAIALTVLSCLHQYMMDRITEPKRLDRKNAPELCRLNGPAVENRLDRLMPEAERLEDMNGLLCQTIADEELRGLTMAQAEERLFGGHAARFFQERFADPCARLLEEEKLEEELRRSVWNEIAGNPELGLYCALLWTSEQDDSVLHQELGLQERETRKLLEECRQELEVRLQESVGTQDYGGRSFFRRNHVRQYARYHFKTIYGQRLAILRLETKLALLNRLERALALVHREISQVYEQLPAMGRRLKEAGRMSITQARDYLGRNIPEYYAVVVGRLLQDMENKRGPDFLFQERFLGNVAESLRLGSGELLERMMAMCRRDIFTCPPFRQSFEEELLERANVGIPYSGEEENSLLSKEELYSDLHRTLEEHAAVHLDTYSYTRKHRYEERYYFGDAGSEFIRYALAAEHGSPFKRGCVHEKRASGIGKLNLMGGFQLNDVMYYRNGLKYYESYAAGGYVFHAEQRRLSAD